MEEEDRAGIRHIDSLLLLFSKGSAPSDEVSDLVQADMSESVGVFKKKWHATPH